ncbi:MAG: heme o synthase [Candidatus Acidiferrales bacterium]
MKPAAASFAAGLRLPANRLADYLELAKPEVTGLVVVSAFAGFYLGAKGPLDWLLLSHTLAGTTLVSAGTAAFNHYLERSEDALMRRTARRPLPAGRLAPRSAFWFAAALSALGVLYLTLAVNPLAGLLAFATWGSYLFFYTPLKKRTVHCTTVGAFPGAMPPLIGWAAASGTLDMNAAVLYAILFFWQFPHFLSIAWIYREDYARGGLLMLPVVDPEGRATGRQMVMHSALLLAVSLLPTFLGMAGALYFWGALILSAAFFLCALAMAHAPSAANARRLLQASIFYLPLLFAFLMLDKT